MSDTYKNEFMPLNKISNTAKFQSSLSQTHINRHLRNFKIREMYGVVHCKGNHHLSIHVTSRPHNMKQKQAITTNVSVFLVFSKKLEIIKAGLLFI